MMQSTLPRWFNDCIGCHILANKNLQPGNESEFGGGEKKQGQNDSVRLKKLFLFWSWGEDGEGKHMGLGSRCAAALG